MSTAAHAAENLPSSSPSLRRSLRRAACWPVGAGLLLLLSCSREPSASSRLASGDVPAPHAAASSAGGPKAAESVALVAAPAAGQVAAPSAAAGASALFPLRISSDKRSLVAADGKPFLLSGNAAWSALAELSKKDALLFLDSQSAHGFNTLLINMLERGFSSHTPKWRNAEGNLPFADEDDFTSVNPAYFAHVDWFLQRAAERGILVLLAPAYLGYQCGDEGWCSHMRENGVAKLKQYGLYLGRRYRSFANIVWVMGGDATPSTRGFTSVMDLVNAVADGIREGDGGSHLMVAHWGREVSGMEGPAAPWLDIDTTYSSTAPHLYQKLLSDRARDAGKRPFFLIESIYENEHKSTTVQLRAQMYQPVLAGGTGFVFGNFPIWALWSPGTPGWKFGDGKYAGGWKEALDGHGTRLAAIAFRFFDSYPWQQLVPDTEHHVVTGGFGSGDAFALCATTPDKKLAVVYMTARLGIDVDLSRFAAPLTARWFDPASGAYSDAFVGSLKNQGSWHFAPPGNNADGAADWVLVLKAD